MSNLPTAREILAMQQQLEALRKADRSAIRLPYTQRIVNPFPLASSGAATGDFPQSGPITIVAFNASVLVQTTNSATQFWVVRLIDAAGNILARFDTNSPVVITPGVWTRMVGIVSAQPSTTNAELLIQPTATLSPGGIFIAPEVLVLV